MRYVIRFLYVTGKAVGAFLLSVLNWIVSKRPALIMLLVSAFSMTVAGAAGLFLPQHFKQYQIISFFFSAFLLTALILSVIFFVALDRFAETIGVQLQQNAALRNAISGLTINLTKTQQTVERETAYIGHLIEALRKHEQTVNNTKDRLASAEEPTDGSV